MLTESDYQKVAHEHGIEWSDKGLIGKYYRELTETGKSIGEWIKE